MIARMFDRSQDPTLDSEWWIVDRSMSSITARTASDVNFPHGVTIIGGKERTGGYLVGDEERP